MTWPTVMGPCNVASARYTAWPAVDGDGDGDGAAVEAPAAGSPRPTDITERSTPTMATTHGPLGPVLWCGDLIPPLPSPDAKCR